MSKIQIVLDKFTVGFSVFCAIHCVLTPIAMVILPALAATIFGDEKFHLLMLIGVLPSSVIALTMGCRKHKEWSVVILGLIGLAVLTFTAIFGHDLFGHTGEKYFTLLGATIIAYSHIRNHKLCCKYNCHTE